MKWRKKGWLKLESSKPCLNLQLSSLSFCPQTGRHWSNHSKVEEVWPTEDFPEWKIRFLTWETPTRRSESGQKRHNSREAPNQVGAHFISDLSSELWVVHLSHLPALSCCHWWEVRNERVHCAASQMHSILLSLSIAISISMMTTATHKAEMTYDSCCSSHCYVTR